jgi:hypothetical protein
MPLLASPGGGADEDGVLARVRSPRFDAKNGIAAEGARLSRRAQPGDYDHR